jgi:hypothetical protein
LINIFGRLNGRHQHWRAAPRASPLHTWRQRCRIEIVWLLHGTPPSLIQAGARQSQPPTPVGSASPSDVTLRCGKTSHKFNISPLNKCSAKSGCRQNLRRLLFSHSMSALGHKRTFRSAPGMSALGQKQTSALQKGMSALPPIATAKADFRKRSCPLYPRKRTCAAQTVMSALGQKRTCDE